MSFQLRDPQSSAFDLLSLGEVMLRLDPGEGRVHTARQFTAWEGGGEYNVARGLRRCFGLKTALVTRLRRQRRRPAAGGFHPPGRRGCLSHALGPYDGIGRDVRNGLNFTERGFGVRGAVGTPDRGHTAASQIKLGDIDWEHVFGTLGVRWFHTGGIFAALSETTAEVIIEAAKAAKKHGTLVSFDLNYRPRSGRASAGEKSAGGQPRDRPICGRDDRQRGRFHREPGLRGRGRGRNISHVPSRVSRP